MSEIITWEELPEEYIARLKRQHTRRGNPGNKQASKYLNIITAFDIETSPVPGREEAGMYIWQWQFGRDYTVMGRTWDDLRCLLAKIREVMPKDKTLVVLVHNLSYLRIPVSSDGLPVSA